MEEDTRQDYTGEGENYSNQPEPRIPNVEIFISPRCLSQMPAVGHYYKHGWKKCQGIERGSDPFPDLGVPGQFMMASHKISHNLQFVEKWWSQSE